MLWFTRTSSSGANGILYAGVVENDSRNTLLVADTQEGRTPILLAEQRGKQEMLSALQSVPSDEDELKAGRTSAAPFGQGLSEAGMTCAEPVSFSQGWRHDSIKAVKDHVHIPEIGVSVIRKEVPVRRRGGCRLYGPELAGG